MGIIIIAGLTIFKNNCIANSRHAPQQKKKRKVIAKLEDKISLEKDM